ncbi:MAG: hypothetical protein KBT04_00180, partial [Bacteroidales bacterium]|nr:hypothetical protein [Candidatus Colimorpha onthohippi]
MNKICSIEKGRLCFLILSFVLSFSWGVAASNSCMDDVDPNTICNPNEPGAPGTGYEEGWESDGIAFDTVVACDSAQWYENWYSVSGAQYVIQGIKAHNGCDSVKQLVLELYHTDYKKLSPITACDSFLFAPSNQWFKNSGNYSIVRELQSHDGHCDSIYELSLKIVSASNRGDTVIKGCSYVIYNFNQYLKDTSWTDVTDNDGCDSLTDVHIKVYKSAVVDSTIYGCDSLEFDGGIYRMSTTMLQPMGSTVDGCDSSIRFHIEINHSDQDIKDAYAGYFCDSFYWDATGMWYDALEALGRPKAYLKNQYKCDSIVSLWASVWPSQVTSIDTAVCDSFVWNGRSILHDTNIVSNVMEKDIHGCDSMLNISLIVQYTAKVEVTQSSCDSLFWNGRYLKQSSSYFDTLKRLTVLPHSAGACDSIVKLNLTVNHAQQGQENLVACDSLFYLECMNYKDTSAIVNSGKTVDECDSTTKVTIVIGHPTTGEQFTSACDYYKWNGVTYAKDTIGPQMVVRNHWGCDSTVTLRLILHQSVYTDTFADVCDSIRWYDSTYFGGEPTHTFKHVTYWRCDSVVKLHINLKHGSYRDTIATACDSFQWRGNVYYATTTDRTPYRQYVNSQDCDSAVRLFLLVNYTTYGDTISYECDSFTWHGITYATNDTTPVYHYINSRGCDSVVSLNLRMRFSTVSDIEGAACGHLIWRFKWCDATGIYQDTIYNSVGCDSVMRLHLTINPLDEGGVSGLYEVETGRYVSFAQGNLQYSASSDQWRFAEHQYDFIGLPNANISENYNGWIDLFGWATSGYHNVADYTNVSYQPWASNNVTISDELNSKGFGPSTFMADQDLTGFASGYDWGLHNAIQNGGGAAGHWRTLTADEWTHLLFYRPDAINKRASATVYGVSGDEKVYGVVLLPETWFLPDNCTYNPGADHGFATNVYSNVQWQAMHDAGAVFLPAAGSRFVDDVDGQDEYGYYWSATHYDAQDAYLFVLTHSTMLVDRYPRHIGRSVRLAQDVDGTTIPCTTYGDTSAVVESEFLWYDEVLTESGDYRRVSPEVNAAGCDSVVFIHLTVGVEGVSDVMASRFVVSVWNQAIHIFGADQQPLQIFDAQGRLLEYKSHIS